MMSGFLCWGNQGLDAGHCLPVLCYQATSLGFINFFLILRWDLTCPGWLWTSGPPPSGSQVPGVMGMHHQALFFFIDNGMGATEKE